MGPLPKLGHRIGFALAIGSIIAFFTSGVLVDTDKFISFWNEYEYLFLIYVLALFYHIYTMGYCVFDLGRRKKLAWALVWIPLCFAVPLVANWVYFERHIFRPAIPENDPVGTSLDRA